MFILCLTSEARLWQYLNMFKTLQGNRGRSMRQPVTEKTKEHIFSKALELFRSRGFEITTMRDIARAADVATGAAYYYFPSKEAIVSAYYDRVQEIHGARVREEVAGKAGLRERLGAVLHAKLDILKNDRLFLGALFRYTGEPGHPLSVFGKETQEQRRKSMEIFGEATAALELSDELRRILPLVLWLGHLAMILFFIHDESEEQVKTRKLVDGALDVFAGVVEFTSSPLVRPFVRPMQERLLSMLREAGLVAEI